MASSYGLEGLGLGFRDKGLLYMLGTLWRYMGTSFAPMYIQYAYMGPWNCRLWLSLARCQTWSWEDPNPRSLYTKHSHRICSVFRENLLVLYIGRVGDDSADCPGTLRL